MPKRFFRIDKVVNHREEGGETEYLVRWKGYDESHDEWQKEQDVTSAALDEYREQLSRTKIDKGEECKKEKLEEQHQLDIEDETDEKFFRRTTQNPEKQVCRYRFASGCKESRKAHARNAGAPRMENY